jgi:AcrR family transcriptional regulator
VPVAAEDAGARRRARVAAVQRARILAAVYEVCAEQGAARLSVGAVVARAGVSRRTFYELFDGAGDCLLAALEDTLARARAAVLAAWRGERPWRVRVRAALIALLAQLDAEPRAARLLLVDSLAAGPAALALRAAALAPVIAAVAEGERARTPRRSAAPLSPLLAEALVGGALAILHARVLAAGPPAISTDAGARPADTAPTANAGAPPPLLELANPLLALIVLPYLGPAASAAELERELPAPRARGPAAERGGGAGGDALRRLPMRVTYRTMRVLAAVAAEPGGSNRPIGHAAGVADQGQISKLLWRLERLGLVVNEGAGQGPGTRNAWRLTGLGEELCAGAALAGSPRRP